MGVSALREAATMHKHTGIGGKEGIFLVVLSGIVAALPLVQWARSHPKPKTEQMALPPVIIASPTQPEITQLSRHNLWQRVRHVYTRMALLTFNTLLLCVVLLLVGNWVLPFSGGASPAAQLGIGATYSGGFNRNYYYYMSDSDVDVLLKEYDRLAVEGHWQVHPWTGLTLRGFQARFLNIDGNGHRLTAPPDTTYAEKPPLVIWTFGGSTLFGWGLADNYTLPSQLQVELQNRLPERQVQVINFGVPFYNSAQEIALFVAYLRRFPKPDIAFFLDGVNDLWLVMNQNELTPLIKPVASAWEARIDTFTGRDLRWITFNPLFPLNRLATQLGLNPNPLTHVSPYYAFMDIEAFNEEEMFAFAVRNYRDNQRMAQAIGDEFDVMTYFFLQPWDYPFYPQFLQSVTENNDIPHMFDLTNAFSDADTTRETLVDALHYSDYGTQILAQKIASILIESYPSGD